MLSLVRINESEYVLVLDTALVHGTKHQLAEVLHIMGLPTSEIADLFDALDPKVSRSSSHGHAWGVSA